MTTPPRVKIECWDCAQLPDDERPKTPRKTDGAPRRPRCATHKRGNKRATKKTRQATYQERNFNLTPEQHRTLLEVQGNVCAICLYANGRTKALATDHDHSCCNASTSCGQCVRGKLCGPDNQDLIGRIEMIARRNGERPTDVLLRTIAYFEDPPMNRVRRTLELITA